MKLRHFISTKQITSRSMLEKLFKRADVLEHNLLAGKLKQSLRGKILASIFFEPSTRTRFSFETAMTRLGGNLITTENATTSSSLTKGESLEDTIKIINGYADVIVMRHFKKGAAAVAAQVSKIPVINAGDGPGEHPTQALLDIYTIAREKDKIDNLRIGMVGDLLYGRTVHSQLPLLRFYKNIHLDLISPPQLRLPQEYKTFLKEHKISFQESSDLEQAVRKVDVLYVTRVQKERFASVKVYERLKNAFVITPTILRKMKKDAIIMHPLPRVTEIDPAVDSDPRASYFRQAINGVYIRMALLEHLLL